MQTWYGSFVAYHEVRRLIKLAADSRVDPSTLRRTMANAEMMIDEFAKILGDPQVQVTYSIFYSFVNPLGYTAGFAYRKRWYWYWFRSPSRRFPPPR
jgi:hypothetical protein